MPVHGNKENFLPLPPVSSSNVILHVKLITRCSIALQCCSDLLPEATWLLRPILKSNTGRQQKVFFSAAFFATLLRRNFQVVYEIYPTVPWDELTPGNMPFINEIFSSFNGSFCRLRHLHSLEHRLISRREKSDAESESGSIMMDDFVNYLLAIHYRSKQ